MPSGLVFTVSVGVSMKDEADMERNGKRSSFALAPVSKLLDKLGKHSPVRAWLEQQKDMTGSGGTLLRALTNPKAADWVSRAVGYHLLGQVELSPSEQAHANHILANELEASLNRGFTARLGSSVLLATAIAIPPVLVSYVLAVATTPQNARPPFYTRELAALAILFFTAPVGILVLAASLSLGLTLMDRRRNRVVQRHAATALAAMANPNCIAFFFGQVRRRTTLHKEALLALRKALPSVTEDWYRRLPPEFRQVLFDIAEWPDEEIALAALDAIAQAGDGNLAKYVDHIAKSGSSSNVRERAAVVSGILKRREEHEQAAASLLRPSESMMTDHLLRPTYGNTPSALNLLKPSQRESIESTDG